MIAGTLARSGYFMGDQLTPAREANPKGFFEDWEINFINEDLLAQVVPKRLTLMGREFFRSRPLNGQRWLAHVPLGTYILCPPEITQRIKTVTERIPYCFKDPRFCYTLPVWRPFLNNVGFVCVFRDPANTASSIVKECKDALYLQTLMMTFRQALKVWTQMYTHVLNVHRHKGAWLFLHYNQLLTGEGLNRLETFLNAPVDRSFPEASLNRSFSDVRVPKKTWRVYQELCELAGYESLSEERTAFAPG
jgi:hypothetical protein